MCSVTVYGRDPRTQTLEWRRGAIEALHEYLRDLEAEGGRYGHLDPTQQDLEAKALEEIKVLKDCDKPEEEKSMEPEKSKREIVVRYSSIDRCHKRGTFRTLAGARKFAHRWVGPHPDVSLHFGYAVSDDGIGKVTWEGCTADELFPEVDDPRPGKESLPCFEGCASYRGGDCTCGRGPAPMCEDTVPCCGDLPKTPPKPPPKSDPDCPF